MQHSAERARPGSEGRRWTRRIQFYGDRHLSAMDREAITGPSLRRVKAGHIRGDGAGPPGFSFKPLTVTRVARTLDRTIAAWRIHTAGAVVGSSCGETRGPPPEPVSLEERCRSHFR